MIVVRPKHLRSLDCPSSLVLFNSNCKMLKVPKAKIKILAQQRLMPWLRALRTKWVYECARHHNFRVSEIDRVFPLYVGPSAYKRLLLTVKNADTADLKPVA